MAFTYTPATPTDITRVRFHVGDVTEATPIFTDDDITFAIAECDNDWKKAVLMCIRNIIARMSAEPNFTADWLRVDYASGLAGYRALLALKADELGVALSSTTVVGTAVRVQRADVVDGDV